MQYGRVESRYTFGRHASFDKGVFDRGELSDGGSWSFHPRSLESTPRSQDILPPSVKREQWDEARELERENAVKEKLVEEIVDRALVSLNECLSDIMLQTEKICLNSTPFSDIEEAEKCYWLVDGIEWKELATLVGEMTDKMGEHLVQEMGNWAHRRLLRVWLKSEGRK